MVLLIVADRAFNFCGPGTEKISATEKTFPEVGRGVRYVKLACLCRSEPTMAKKTCSDCTSTENVLLLNWMYKYRESVQLLNWLHKY